MMHDFLCTLQDGQVINCHYLLTEVSLGTTCGGSPYLNGTLSDVSDSLSVRFWDYSGPISERDCGKAVHVEGTVSSYRNRLQLVCSRLEVVPLSAIDPTEIGALIPLAPIDVNQRICYLYDEITSIRNRSLYAVTKTLVERHWDAFIRIPAALGVHHAFVNGLLMHTTDMAAAAEGLCRVYGDRINRDLLLAGVILHDIGKTSEFTIAETGLVEQYSPLGKALGHSVIGVEEIGQVGAELGVDPEAVMLLQNLLASHHGKQEYGAAAGAITLEGELLHELDSIDSRVEIYREALQSVPEGEFSPYIRPLSKQVYRPRLLDVDDGSGRIDAIPPLPPVGMNVEAYLESYDCWRH